MLRRLIIWLSRRRRRRYDGRNRLVFSRGPQAPGGLFRGMSNRRGPLASMGAKLRLAVWVLAVAFLLWFATQSVQALFIF